MAEKSKRLSKEEIEDLEIEFSMEHGDGVARLESLLIDIYDQCPETTEEKFKRCNDFIETTNQLKEFCKQHGRGGVSYYNEQVKGDIRLEAIKNELKFLKKYPNGVTLENALLEIHKYLKKHGAVVANQLYKNFDGLDYPVIPTIKLMVKIDAVCVDESEYPKVYYLPTEEGQAALFTIRGIQQKTAEEIEQVKDSPIESIAFDTEQLTSQLDDMITQVDKEIDSRKKKGFFSKLFGNTHD